ncbi:MAG: hypothetical protein HDR46_02895 [Bacteroides sp.]|nr:hypothetical protein [Bacteroides sp.]MBD5391406.1 hypothetical protein [bacterium]MBD5415211.1 hypothetical protein [Bacteroides sp.]
MNLKALLLLAAGVAVGPVAGFADDKNSQVLFQDSEMHMSQPELRIFVTPQVCDMEMINPDKPRAEFSSVFEIRSLESLTEAEFTNFKNRTLYMFAKEHGADIIIEPIFNSYIVAGDNKLLRINVTGFPARYVNFRPLGKSDVDLEMVRVVYPAGYQKVVESKQRQ